MRPCASREPTKTANLPDAAPTPCGRDWHGCNPSSASKKLRKGANANIMHQQILSYTFAMPDPKDNYRLYIENASEMLEVAEENLDNGHYSSACNRAYYAIFYAASALLYSKGKSYGKHSAVLAAFRQFFIKTGEFDKKWSDDYEYVMGSRHTADYDLYDSLEKEDTLSALAKAQEFVEEVKKWLQKNDLL